MTFYTQNTLWQKAILLVDMNAFFAAIEQQDFPELRGKPIAVTNGSQGTCIITCSYEARSYGVKTGMRLAAGRRHCPQLIQRPARPERYAQISNHFISTLNNITPDIEVFSVDEAFLDITHCQLLWGTPESIAVRAQQLIREHVQLPCSIGLSGDKTTAKFAAKQNKPNGLTVIPPWQAKEALANIPVTELCGIAKGIGRFLASHGVYYCKDMAKIPLSVLTKRFGRLGTRLWYMCQGCDPDELHDDWAPNKTLGHGKVLPPNTTQLQVVLCFLIHMCEKVAARLRRHQLVAQQYFIGVRSRMEGWCAREYRLLFPTNDRNTLFDLAHQFVNQVWPHSPVDQVQVTALDPHMAKQQQDLFSQPFYNSVQDTLNSTIDEINQRFGKLAVTAGRLLGRSSMPDVIAPAWKPFGQRCTVDCATTGARQ